MNLYAKTIKAHLKHLHLRMDNEGCIWKGEILLFSSPLDENKRKDAAFNWLEGYLACYDN